MLPENWSTRRLSLRPPRPEDATAIFDAWATDAEVTRYLTWCPHQRIEQTQQFVNACIEAWQGTALRPWVIATSPEAKPIGMIELRLDGFRAEIGYVLARAAWGQGYMTEIVQSLTQVALHEVPVVRVAAICDLENGASARVLEKSGLIREGQLRRYVVHPNVSDEPRDVYLYARTRPLRACMQAEAVLQILTELGSRNLPVWIGGGWGIDALLREQSRDHGDLDLACRAEDEATMIAMLRSIGYRVVLEYRPARVVMADNDGHEVDLHPVRFHAQGSGVQAGPRGEEFQYPPDAFGTGFIAGQAVQCLSAQQQLRFHAGYELREHERQDLERLKRSSGTR